MQQDECSECACDKTREKEKRNTDESLYVDMNPLPAKSIDFVCVCCVCVVCVCVCVCV